MISNKNGKLQLGSSLLDPGRSSLCWMANQDNVTRELLCKNENLHRICRIVPLGGIKNVRIPKTVFFGSGREYIHPIHGGHKQCGHVIVKGYHAAIALRDHLNISGDFKTQRRRDRTSSYLGFKRSPPSIAKGSPFMNYDHWKTTEPEEYQYGKPFWVLDPEGSYYKECGRAIYTDSEYEEGICNYCAERIDWEEGRASLSK